MERDVGVACIGDLGQRRSVHIRDRVADEHDRRRRLIVHRVFRRCAERCDEDGDDEGDDFLDHGGLLFMVDDRLVEDRLVGIHSANGR
jgi:hypothetical protein